LLAKVGFRIYLIHIIGNINYYIINLYFGRQSICIHAKLLVLPIRTR